MLTTTYSLVALSAEQKNSRSMLSRLHSQLQNILQDMHSMNRTCGEKALLLLDQFEEYCHQRKMEMYVIPAIRKSTRMADPILAELEFLSSCSMRMLRSLHEQLRHAFERGAEDVRKLCVGIDLYCSNLFERLAKEEEELFPIARNALSIEEWFDIAAKFLSEDKKHRQFTAALPHDATRPNYASVSASALALSST